MDKCLRPGDIVINGSKQVALLIRQTKRYWYYLLNGIECRTSKEKLWRNIDLGNLSLSYGTTLKNRRKQKKNRILDLHGTKHQDAEEKIRRYLNFIELPTRVITGHSREMKSILFSVVEEYNWTYTEDPLNLGEVIVFGD